MNEEKKTNPWSGIADAIGGLVGLAILSGVLEALAEADSPTEARANALLADALDPKVELTPQERAEGVLSAIDVFGKNEVESNE